MGVKVTCDECKAEFEAELENRIIGKHNGEVVTKVFFKCPCGKEYHAFYDTPKIKRLKAKISTLRDQIKGCTNRAEVERAVRRQERYSAEIKEVSDRLKSLF